MRNTHTYTHKQTYAIRIRTIVRIIFWGGSALAFMYITEQIIIEMMDILYSLFPSV